MVLAGSATPALSIEDLVQLSSNKDITSRNLSFTNLKISSGPFVGSENLRTNIADLYDESVSAGNVLVTNGATGANLLAFQSMIKTRDHVITMYPSYMQLLSLPKAVAGLDVSYWKADVHHNQGLDFQELRELVQPNTKMIIINNPNNPLGSILTPEMQQKIVDLARANDITLVVDEIFRPLFHGAMKSQSFLEMADKEDKVIVTSSMSKAWGLNGTRVGWLATKNATIFARCFNLSLYTCAAVGRIDEIIAGEALSERCRQKILAKHLLMAQKNLELLDNFVSDHQEVCAWVRPTAGGTAFLRFTSQGNPVNDVDWCKALKREKGLLLAPGSLCFGSSAAQDFRGFVRIHVTIEPEKMRLALVALSEFLNENKTP